MVKIERVNRDLTPMLSKLDHLKNKWDRYLPEVEFGINNSFCRSIGNSISVLLFGINQRDKNEDVKTSIEFNNQKDINLTEIRATVQDTNQKLQEYNKKQFDSNIKFLLNMNLASM